MPSSAAGSRAAYPRLGSAGLTQHKTYRVASRPLRRAPGVARLASTSRSTSPCGRALLPIATGFWLRRRPRRRSPDYLCYVRRADRVPQNSMLDGEEVFASSIWTGSLPIVLAWQLGRTGADDCTRAPLSRLPRGTALAPTRSWDKIGCYSPATTRIDSRMVPWAHIARKTVMRPGRRISGGLRVQATSQVDSHHQRSPRRPIPTTYLTDNGTPLRRANPLSDGGPLIDRASGVPSSRIGPLGGSLGRSEHRVTRGRDRPRSRTTPTTGPVLHAQLRFDGSG